MGGQTLSTGPIQDIGQVERQVNALHSTAEELEDVIGRLIVRVESIFLDSPLQPPLPENKPHLVPLAAVLEGANCRILRSVDTLRALVANIEL
jgi:hypothetical protein